ncbi:hypothetical protein D3C81_1580910 [compost metagenome]
MIHIAGITGTGELHEKVVPDLHDDGVVMTGATYQSAEAPFVLLSEVDEVSPAVMPGIRTHNNPGVTHLVGKTQPIMQTRLIDFCLPFKQVEEVLQILLRKPRHNHRTDIFIDILQPAVLSRADLRTTPIV